MVKLSDIIKLGYQKHEEDEKKEKAKTSQDVKREEKAKVQEKPTQDAQPPKTHPEKTSEDLKLSKAFKDIAQGKIKERTIAGEDKVSLSTMMNSMQEEKKNTKILYKKGLLILKHIFAKIELKEHFDITELMSFIREIVDEISVDKKELIELALVGDYDNSLWQHSLNACILAINIGLSLGYNKIKLNGLGLSACLYDCGLVKMKVLINF